MSAGTGKECPSRVAVAEGKDPLAPERRTDLPHQVQPPRHQEAAEDVEPPDRAVGLWHVDLEGRRGVASDDVAPVRQGPLQAVGLARDVDRVLVDAEVAQVGVAVVAQQRAAAHRPEQGAVGQEGLNATLVQGAQDVADGPHQRLHVLLAAHVEGLDATQRLVQRDRSSVGGLDRDAARAASEPHAGVEHRLRGVVDGDGDLRGAVEEAAQRLGPRHQVAPPAALAVSVQPERPHASSVEKHVEDRLGPASREDTVVVDADVSDRPRPQPRPQHGPRVVSPCSTSARRP